MVTYKDLKQTFPEEKKSVESIYGRIFPARKISYFFTIPFINLNVSAFQASIISIVIAILASIFLCIPNTIVRVIGVILVPIWHIFDCVDGNIARYNKSSSEYGETVDAISGYYMFAFLPFSLGVAAYNIENNPLGVHAEYFLIFGAIGSIADLLMRLIHQKYAYTGAIIEEKTGKHIEKGDNQYSLKGFHHLRKMIDVEMGPVGIPMFILWLAPVFNLFWLLSFYYAILFSGSLIIATIYYLKKCHEVDK